MSKLKCFFGLHDYSPWGNPIDTYYSYEKNQFRFCKECNKIETRSFSHKINIQANEIIKSMEKTK